MHQLLKIIDLDIVEICDIKLGVIDTSDVQITMHLDVTHFTDCVEYLSIPNILSKVFIKYYSVKYLELVFLQNKN